MYFNGEIVDFTGYIMSIPSKKQGVSFYIVSLELYCQCLAVSYNLFVNITIAQCQWNNPEGYG